MSAAIPVERALLVSDLHLRRPEDERARRFLDFLERRVLPDPPDLFVVAGDLFDFCMAVRGRLPRATRPVVEALEALPRVLWIEGNHDFHLAPALKGSPIEHRPDRVELRWAGRRVHVEHGDLIRRGGRVTRRLLTSPLAVAGATLLGTELSWRLGTGYGVRRSGEHGYDGRRPGWLDQTRAWAAGMSRQGFDLVVLGHGHWLGRWDGLVCLGDWVRLCSYAELGADGELRLRRYVPSASVDPLVEREPSPR